ncbi:Holliday junction resolvase RuvX, partial [Candidatus Woesebacteria bacterium]|nr:Holliday junction resolvase RuvX [Candidatus Woesebacteria bacterium]
MKAQTVLALDFGTVRIGCAVSYGTLAEPITVIANTPEVFEQILKLIETHAITQILV